jgi:hypothetical protein
MDPPSFVPLYQATMMPEGEEARHDSMEMKTSRKTFQNGWFNEINIQPVPLQEGDQREGMTGLHLLAGLSCRCFGGGKIISVH